MCDYSTSKIYKIICNDTNEVYVGSTIESLQRRLSRHVSDAKHKTRLCTSSEIINRGNFRIELIEDFPCENKHQLLHRERFYIEHLNCVNKCIPITTCAEKQEAIKRNHDKWNPIMASLPPIQCECGSTYTYKHKTRHEAGIPHRLGTDPVFKQQYDEETAKRKEEHKQRKREYKAQWYQAHKPV
jgi:group I intron endonuclease